MSRKKYDKDFTQVPWIPAVESAQELTEFSLHQELIRRQKLHRKPSWKKITFKQHLNKYEKLPDDFGAAFTTTAYQIHNRKLMKERIPLKTSHPASDQILTSPPLEYHKQYKGEVRQGKEHVHFLPSNIVSLKDLADGTWLSNNLRREVTNKFKRVGKIKKLKNAKQDLPSQWKNLQQHEAELPKSIEEQRDNFLKEISDKEKRYTEIEDNEIIYWNDPKITSNELDSYDFNNLEEAKRYIADKLQRREDFDELLDKLKSEIIDCYKQHLQYTILDCILVDLDERRRLRIDTSPAEYQLLTIRAPVPWHQPKLIAEHYMQYNLFTGNEILKDIWDLTSSK